MQMILGGGRGVSRRTLDAFFRPKNVAVIGATERPGTVGRAILWNLISSPFGGAVLPVNPKHGSVLGIKAYPNIREAGEVDLAVVATPAATVPGVVAECAAAGVKAAIIVSAGFREVGAAGLELERQVLAEARRGGMRIVGPNCLRVMCPSTGLNATFANAMARPGNVGFISQSGALCTAILDWSLREAVGFSAFISIGSMTDVGWGDLIQYLGDDQHTQSIILYIESIGHARAFLSAAREVALTKPVIALKAGRTEAAAKAAASHTGALAGSDEVLDAAFRRCGVLRVNGISDLFYMSEVLAKQPRPKGPCLTIVTNAGGPGVLATDALISQGACLAELVRYDGRRAGPASPSALEPSQSHRHAGGCQSGTLREGGRDRGQGPSERRIACDSHASGNDESYTDRGRDQIFRQAAWKADSRKLDGRSERRGRRRHPGPRRRSLLPLSRHSGAHVPLHVALQL
jgi:acetyltransferase